MVVLLAVAACARPDNDPVETRHGTSQIKQVPEPAVPEDHRRVEGPSFALSSIDSLMWRQPDSALAVLLNYLNDDGRDAARHVSTDQTFDNHYTHLLLSELLYKNDCEQTNRRDLQKAVAYFDSIMQVPEPAVPEAPRRVEGPSFKRNVFLTARAHYINGVGYYEKDSVVEACAEYLKTLEVMEGWFEGNEFVREKAKFMSYTYNRLGGLFSSQFMMEPSILCYKEAQFFCMIEPTSSFGVSNNFYRIGLQYNKIGQKDTALYYYEKAIENLPDTNCLIYRNISTNKALLCYQINKDAEVAILNLKNIISQAADESERLTRCLTIGDVYYEEGLFDSAKFYLERVFEKNTDEISQIQAAEYLRYVYDNLGESDKSDTCVHFLADHKKSVGENKALTSKLETMFKTYLNQKQEREAEAAREKAIKKTIGIIGPIAFVVTLAIIVLAKVRSKKLLKDQQEEADKVLEETEQQHRMQQAALAGRLKKSNEELRDVSMQLEQTLAKAPSESTPPDDYTSYVNAAICQYIVGVVHEQQFKSKMDYLVYKDSALSKEQLLSLHNAAEKHLPRFVSQIRKQFSRLTESDMDYCYLFLLGLSEADVSALMQRAYTTVCDRSRKISRILGANDSLYHTLRNCLSE